MKSKSTKYTWRDGARFKTDAQVAGDELEAIRQRNDGRLTPEAIVRESEPSDAPLHAEFEWDNAAAAHQFRLGQGRFIARSVRVVVDDDASHGVEVHSIRAFPRVRQGDDEQATYTHVSVVLASKELRQQVHDTALREMVAWRKRYQDIERDFGSFLPVTKAMDDLFESLHPDARAALAALSTSGNPTPNGAALQHEHGSKLNGKVGKRITAVGGNSTAQHPNNDGHRRRIERAGHTQVE